MLYLVCELSMRMWEIYNSFILLTVIIFFILLTDTFFPTIEFFPLSNEKFFSISTFQMFLTSSKKNQRHRRKLCQLDEFILSITDRYQHEIREHKNMFPLFSTVKIQEIIRMLYWYHLRCPKDHHSPSIPWGTNIRAICYVKALCLDSQIVQDYFLYVDTYSGTDTGIDGLNTTKFKSEKFKDVNLILSSSLRKLIVNGLNPYQRGILRLDKKLARSYRILACLKKFIQLHDLAHIVYNYLMHW